MTVKSFVEPRERRPLYSTNLKFVVLNETSQQLRNYHNIWSVLRMNYKNFGDTGIPSPLQHHDDKSSFSEIFYF